MLRSAENSFQNKCSALHPKKWHVLYMTEYTYNNSRRRNKGTFPPKLWKANGKIYWKKKKKFKIKKNLFGTKNPFLLYL